MTSSFSDNHKVNIHSILTLQNCFNHLPVLKEESQIFGEALPPGLTIINNE